MATEEAMTIDEHVRTALKFLEHSDQEFAAGDILQGSEKLWGAASQAVIAVAMQRGWQFSHHHALRVAVDALAEERDDQSLLSGMLAAEKFHANFYHGFLAEDIIELDRPLVADFVRRMVAMVDGTF